MNRTFHHRFTIGAACGIILLIGLTLYCFWIKSPILGVLMALALVIVTEHAIHKEYVFHDDKLIIINGRLMRNKVINVSEIKSCRPMTSVFGLVHFLVITYGATDQIEAVQPVNEQEFTACLEKLREEEDVED